jgi:hypothetical protein
MTASALVIDMINAAVANRLGNRERRRSRHGNALGVQANRMTRVNPLDFAPLNLKFSTDGPERKRCQSFSAEKAPF